MKNNSTKSIDISDYNYQLPDNRIAKYPLAKRDQSKLLCYSNGTLKIRSFFELSGLLPSHSLMIFNNTRVIHARILFKKETGATIEVFCLSPYKPKDYALSFEQTKTTVWTCMVGNARRWKQESLALELNGDMGKVTLYATKLSLHNQEYEIEFSWNNPEYSFADILEEAGNLPIPPYLNRPTEESDEETYQTVYSQIKGSVAAPTAGLHFTESVMTSLSQRNITLSEVTLHVGAGTFRPVKAETIGQHEMHTELISVERSTIERMLSNNEKLVVVGTTSLRTIESLYYIGAKILKNPTQPITHFIVEQWEPYDADNNIFKSEESLNAILEYMNRNELDLLVASTRIMIAPGYEFKFVDGLLTNFHQPQSTLLLLVSAFVGSDWKKMYDFALQNNFRFLSYGDSSLLWRNIK
ncbi:MAG TPA: S-adenosylmethionine:tRNA ribosyltransferase-isomerase [Dysgonamonadaceae bacterium]|nr:S-adenosylmethionine:tRNA ribosyltransferase-isomerase [Dysgonamonadaceae bacterium]